VLFQDTILRRTKKEEKKKRKERRRKTTERRKKLPRSLKSRATEFFLNRPNHVNLMLMLAIRSKNKRKKNHSLGTAECSGPEMGSFDSTEASLAEAGASADIALREPPKEPLPCELTEATDGEGTMPAAAETAAMTEAVATAAGFRDSTGSS
jgi:hypothetical protein